MLIYIFAFAGCTHRLQCVFWKRKRLESSRKGPI